VLPDVAQGELQEILIVAYGDGRASSYLALDAVVQPFGIRVGVVAGAEGEPMAVLVPRLIDAIWRKGSQFRTEVCRSYYRALPWCRPLRDWIVRYQPADLPLVTETQLQEAEVQRSRIVTVADAFDRIRGLDSPDLQVQIAAAHEDLHAVANKLLVLRACKAIHDTLHGIQTGIYTQLMPLAAKVGSLGPGDLELISTQLFTLDNAVIDIESNLDSMSGELSDRLWLDDFKDALAPLREQPPAGEGVETALYGLRGVLRQQLPRFDAAIVDAAKAVPFGAAIAFLRDAANRFDRLAGAKDALDAAAGELAKLDASLAALTALHEAWQKADAPLWQIEQQLEQTLRPGAESRSAEGLKLTWRAVLRRLDAIKVLSAAMWDAVIDSSIANVSEKLEEEPQLNEAAAAALNSFIRMARLQFLRVDKTVLAQCTQIGKLREPIEKLLEEGKGNAG
jgi:hypothetical protein